jgi:hypothetical protein
VTAVTGGVTADQASGARVPAGLLPTRVGNHDLEQLAFEVPEVLSGDGGREMTAMLDALGLRPSDVSLVLAYARDGALAIGRWELPRKPAADISAAWDHAAGAGWRADELGSEAALTGQGADGRRAWAVARDSVFLYVVSDDAALAATAVAATR